VSAISAILSESAPWSFATLAESGRCETFSFPSFGLNDPKSISTCGAAFIVPNSKNETANFGNPHSRVIHCLKYGDYVHSIPRPHEQPSQCDFILYDDNSAFMFLVEMKITLSQGTRVRQLRNTLQSLMTVQSVRAFSDRFPSKRCCFFRKTPPQPASMLTAPRSFHRVSRMMHGVGRKVSRQQLNADVMAHGFELWHFSDNDVCQLV